MIPSNYRLEFTEAQLTERVTHLGHEFGEWAKHVYDTTGKDLLCVPVLRGGIYFFADLMRRIECSIEMAPIRTRSYVDSVNAAERSSVEVNLDGLDVTDRSLLLVDDICDSGRTFRVLSELLAGHGATEVRSAALIKREHDACIFEPNWAAFRYHGPEWFVGYGMEDSNRYTNLPQIYTIHPKD